MNYLNGILKLSLLVFMMYVLYCFKFLRDFTQANKYQYVLSKRKDFIF